jgi:dGTP triphosphohydrolase
MSSVELDSSKNFMVMSLLARELKREIPELDLYGQERSLLDFAYHDLETCLKAKWKDLRSAELEETLKAEDRQEELNEFLKVWIPQWLEKWRERVTLCQQLPHFSLEHAKTKRKAAELFKRMENGQELKKLVAQKLIDKGEVCMAEMLAENLIVEEITHRLRMNRGKTPTDKTAMEPLNIFQAVLPRVKRLAERRIPLIYLKLITDF